MSNVKMNAEELLVFNNLNLVQEQLNIWGLATNKEELAGAIHTIQLFIIMHMLYRENSSQFSNWYFK